VRGLNAPPAQNRGTGFLHDTGNGENLVPALHGARAAHQDDLLLVANLDAVDINHRALVREVEARQLVRFHHRRDRADAGKRAEGLFANHVFRSDDADDGAFDTPAGVRFQPPIADGVLNVRDLFVGRVRFADDDHINSTLSSGPR
jgi:hypothetical protein